MVSPIETVTLERVEVVTQKAVSDALSDLVIYPEPERAPHLRATLYSAVVRGFGKRARFEFRCPATWWQHLKHTIRARWPRLFGRLSVRYRKEVCDTGAVVADLPKLVAPRMVIPYYMRETW